MTTSPHGSVPSASIATLPASDSPSTAAAFQALVEPSGDGSVLSADPATLSLPCAIGSFTAAVVRSDHGHVRRIYVIPACNTMGGAGTEAAERVAAPAAGMTRYGYQRLGSSAASIATLPASDSPSTAVALPTVVELSGSGDDGASSRSTVVALPAVVEPSGSGDHPATISFHSIAIGCSEARGQNENGHKRQFDVVPTCNMMDGPGSVARVAPPPEAPAAAVTRSARGEEPAAALHDGSTLSARGGTGVAETVDPFLPNDDAPLEARVDTALRERPAYQRDSLFRHPNPPRGGQRSLSSSFLGAFDQRAATPSSGLFPTTNTNTTELTWFEDECDEPTPLGIAAATPATPATVAFRVVRRSSTQVFNVVEEAADEVPELAAFDVVEPFFGFMAIDVLEASFVQMPTTASDNDDSGDDEALA